MEYLALNNGVQMPLIGFGTFMLGGETCKNAVTSIRGHRNINPAKFPDSVIHYRERTEHQHLYMSAICR